MQYFPTGWGKVRTNVSRRIRYSKGSIHRGILLKQCGRLMHYMPQYQWKHAANSAGYTLVAVLEQRFSQLRGHGCGGGCYGDKVTPGAWTQAFNADLDARS